MAQALIGGLVKAGRPGASIIVIEPSEGTRRRLVGQFGVSARSAPGPFLEMAELLVWAVKPQNFEIAAARVRRSCRRRAAGERHGRRAQRRGRRRDRQRARHPRHAEHAGADRPGHRRAVRARGRHRRGSRRRDRPARADRRADLGRRGSAARCGDGVVGIGPGLCLSPSRGAARGRAADGACPGRGAPPRRADRRRLGRAGRRVARFARRAAPDRHLARRHDRGGDGGARDARRARRLHRRRAGRAREGRGARQARRRRPIDPVAASSP